MIGHYPSVMVDDSEDDSDGPEPKDSTDTESMTEKFKDLTDTQLDDEIEKYEGYVFGKKNGLKLADEGAKFTIHLRNLQNEKSARQNKRSLATFTPKSQDTKRFNDFSIGSGTVRDGPTRSETRSTTQPELSRGSGTFSIVKTDSFSTTTLLHSPSESAPHEDFVSPAFNNGKSIVLSVTCSQPPSSDRRAPSVERAARVSSGEQAGPSSRELSTPNHSGSCSRCEKSSILSAIPGIDGFFCSVCRRKLRTPDPSVQLDGDLKTPAARAVTRSTRKRAREVDIVGRTPDTAVEIDDSSDEDEKTREGIGSAPKVLPRRMGLRSTYRRRLEGYKVAYPSRTVTDAVEILPSDLERLNPMEFLNDTVIDFYIKYIQRDEFLGAEGRQRFHFFNSFFYKKLSEVVSSQKKKGGAVFSKLRKWTKGTNIFEKDYLFVPIHDKLHWSLAIICFPGSDKGGHNERCIIHLDSMTHGHDSQRVFRLLRSYLVAEWKHSVEAGENEADECIHTVQSLKADAIPWKKVPVPLQENESDCGLFLLHYIQKFVESAPKTMKLSDLEGNWEALGVFGLDWFLSTEASSLRTSIQEQLYRLFEQEITEQELSALEQEKDISNGGTTGACEVVLPLDRQAECKASVTQAIIKAVTGALKEITHILPYLRTKQLAPAILS